MQADTLAHLIRETAALARLAEDAGARPQGAALARFGQALHAVDVAGAMAVRDEIYETLRQLRRGAEYDVWLEYKAYRALVRKALAVAIVIVTGLAAFLALT